MEYTFFSEYDIEKKNPAKKTLNKKLNIDDEFIIDNVTYKIIKKIKPKTFFIKTLKYKIKDTTTTIVHKCPAIKDRIKKLDENDFKKYKSRLKLKTMNVVNYCPTCGVIFYKDKKCIPESFDVYSIKNKVALKKRQ